MIAGSAWIPTAAEPARLHTAAKRASEIDPATKQHPEIDFTFDDVKNGKPLDLQHAVADTSVPTQGRLVIWLMDHSPGLFGRIASYGLHGIQVSYANRWSGALKPEVRDSGDVLANIRLEAATGEDFSPLVRIPKADGLQERAWQFLLWLDESQTPYGNTRRLITTCDVGGNAGRAHSGMIPGGAACKDSAGAFVHEPVWRYLFMHPVDETGAVVPLEADCAMERQIAHGVAATGQAQSITDLVDGPVEVREVAAGFTFTEGPAANGDGDVFFTDIPQQRVHVWRAATGAIDTWLEQTDKLNGLAFRPNGTLLGCQMGEGRRIVGIDPASRAIAPFAERIDGKRFNAPNDLAIDREGGVWFTDPAYGRKPEEIELDAEAVYWIAPDGTTVRQAAGGFQRPNGIALSPDEQTLYVADRDADITVAFPVEGPGRLGPRRRFADTGSDGFAVDEQGNLYVTPKAAVIRVFAPDGKALGEIPLPLPATNLTFGGPDRRTLFITARDRVFTLPMKVKGGQ